MKKDKFFYREDEHAHSIPVILDDVKKYRDFEMARCTYFNIECDAPSPGWSMGPAERGIPFYLLGLTGVIWKPFGEKDFFDSVDLIDELFHAIEEDPSLYVDTNEVWLPNILFKPAALKRGNVFRVRDDLFRAAYSFSADRISKEKFLSFCGSLVEGGRPADVVRHSEKETETFRDWEKEQIRIAKDTYPKKPEYALKWE